MADKPELEIVIPVYNEGANIVPCLRSLKAHVTTSFRVLICYDMEEDTTLPALADPSLAGVDIRPVRNPGRGPHSAVLEGFRVSTAPAVIQMPADDDYNGAIIDVMVERFRSGHDVVAASRFMPGGGGLQGCPWTKAILVQIADFLLFHLARVPTHDATNGFKLYSRRLLTTVAMESSAGHTFGIELTVKAHRLRWRISEVPSKWHERSDRKSRFRIFKWMPAYLRWFFYSFATTWLRRGPDSVPRVAERSPGDA